MSFRSLPVSFLLLMVAASSLGCRTVYYDVLESFGREKRHILASRIEDGRDDQKEAQEEFQDALERFQALTGFDGGDLETQYNRLSTALEGSETKAQAVRDRIDSIETVAGDLFEEWETEISQISRADLRGRSQKRLVDTRSRYGRLIKAMKKAAGRMEPVLVAFRDQVLYLKHNLNASAIASLENDAAQIESDVQRLIAEMNTSIREADAFLESFDS